MNLYRIIWISLIIEPFLITILAARVIAGDSMDAETERQMVSEFGNDIKGVLRRYAVHLLEQGK